MAKSALIIPVQELPPGMPPHVLHNDKLWKLIRVGGFLGHIPAGDIPKESPTMLWEGGRIQMNVWAQICAFFEWGCKTYDSETQVRLYYNRRNQHWAPWAYPQNPNGMTTKEIEGHPDVAEQRRQFPDPWVLLGTVHNHCKTSAFQSGTDQHNEASQEGIHITVGFIGAKEYSLHNRVVVRNQQYTGVPWDSWFEIPEKWQELPPKIQAQVLDHFLKVPPNPDTVFPEQWKKNCIKQTYTVGATNGNYRGSWTGSGPYNGSSQTVYPREWALASTNLEGQFTVSELQFMKECVALMDLKRLQHNVLDMLVNETDFNALPEVDKIVVSDTLALCHKYQLKEDRMDELFDKWDFATVLAHLAKTTAPSIGEAQAAAAEVAEVVAMTPPTEKEAQEALANEGGCCS